MPSPILLHIRRENDRKRYVIPIECISDVVLLGALSTWPRKIGSPEGNYVIIEVVADPEVLDRVVMPDGPLRSCATAILNFTEDDLSAASTSCDGPTVQPQITIWAPDLVDILGSRRKAA